MALSADGSTLVVGAYLWEGSATDQGGVYIYDRSGSAWVQRGAVLTASDAADSDNFGISVALSADGSTLVVGAYLWEGSATDQGGVYIYDRSGSAWVQRGAVLTASDAADSDNFGRSVSLSADGSVLVVGSSNWEGSATNQGGVYTYTLTGALPASRATTNGTGWLDGVLKVGGTTVMSATATVVTVTGTVAATLISGPISSAPPATASSTGVAGTITYDSSYIYICTATNTWKRVAVATW